MSLKYTIMFESLGYYRNSMRQSRQGRKIKLQMDRGVYETVSTASDKIGLIAKTGLHRANIGHAPKGVHPRLYMGIIGNRAAAEIITLTGNRGFSYNARESARATEEAYDPESQLTPNQRGIRIAIDFKEIKSEDLLQQ